MLKPNEVLLSLATAHAQDFMILRTRRSLFPLSLESLKNTNKLAIENLARGFPIAILSTPTAGEDDPL